MNLDEVAKRLGYVDADHVEKNIEAYGEPLIEWWGLIKDLVNELPLNDVIVCEDCNNMEKDNPRIGSGICEKCFDEAMS